MMAHMPNVGGPVSSACMPVATEVPYLLTSLGQKFFWPTHKIGLADVFVDPALVCARWRSADQADPDFLYLGAQGFAMGWANW